MEKAFFDYELATIGSELDFFLLLFYFAGAALLIALIGMAIRNWRLRRLCDPRKDHYRGVTDTRKQR